MSRRLSFSFLVALFFLFFTAAHSRASTPSLNTEGSRIKWSGRPNLQLAGNPSNRSGLSDSDVRSSVVRGLQRWQEASENRIMFDYWQGSQFDRNSDYNGLSNLYFASSATGDTGLSSGVLALTQVWYSTSNGEILETDIVINDNDFYFSTNPADTTGTGSGWPTGRVYLDNVVTHELGHAFGLSHASALQSTMLYIETPDQAHLSCDDQTAIRALYDPSRNSDTGRITGQITTSTGAALFGASVVAISERRGVAVATALTKKDGTYSIESLEPGKYRLMVEPFTASASVLTNYYASLNARVCNGAFFSRQFADQAVSVSAGGVSAQNFSVKCGSSGALVTQSSGSENMSASSPLLIAGGSGTFSKVDRSGYSRRSYYRLKGVSGTFEIHALSYSLYSPVAPTLRLLNSSGAVVLTQNLNDSYQSESGFQNFDAVLKGDQLQFGDYYLEVETNSVSSYQYPLYGNDLDTVSFFVLTGAFNQAEPPLSMIMPNHPKCRTSESFSNYESPSGGPARRDLAGASSEEEKSKLLGFCGTIQRGEPGSSAGGGASFSMIISWFLPWIFMLLSVKLLRPRRVGATLST